MACGARTELTRWTYTSINFVKPVAHDDERKLVQELDLLEEVFDFLRIIEVTLATDALNLSELTGASGSLDIFEVDFRVLTKVDLEPR